MEKASAVKPGTLGYFNLDRGVGILLVLLMHSANLFGVVTLGQAGGGLFAGWVDVVGAGLMAMFFLESGYGYFRRKPRQCLKNQVTMLIVPYYIASALIVLTKLALAVIEHRPFTEHGGNLVLTYLLVLNHNGGGTLFGIPTESVRIYWYPFSLAVGWVILNAIEQRKDTRFRAAMITLCVLVGCGLGMWRERWMFEIPVVLCVVGYLAAGAEIRKRKLLEKKLPWWAYALMLLAIAVSLAFGQINFANCRWRLGPVDLLAAGCIGFLLMRLMAWVKTRVSGRLTAAVETVGLNSFMIILVHGYEGQIVPWYRLEGLLGGRKPLCAVIVFVLRLAFVLAVVKGIDAGKRLYADRRRGKAER